MLKVDSRKIEEGDTFLALRGVDSDGHNFISKAIENGASHIICEEGEYLVSTEIVPDTREYLSNYLKDYYKDVMDNLCIIGFTGTNGKTTSAFLLHNAFNLLGVKCAYIGTVGFYIKEKVKSLQNTTPDLYDLYSMFKEAYDLGCKVVVLEVSSQGISYGRVKGISFDMAIFTNLTQDHLDYHKTMENYALAKQELFYMIKKDGYAFINNDDNHKDYYLLDCNNNITYGMSNSDFMVTDYNLSRTGSVFTLKCDNKEYYFKTKLIGKHNIYNSLSCIAPLYKYGFSMEDICNVFPTLDAPRGRMDVVHSGNNSIVIDYAHTPDAIEKIISTVKTLKPHHIYTIFGCTGDRDKLKRPIMTNIVLNNSDYAIITNDDPHTEDPRDIVKDMLDGVENRNYQVILNRKDAIEKGISLLKENDILLVLGKGHEEFMIVGNEKIPFNDKKIVLELIKEYQI